MAHSAGPIKRSVCTFFFCLNQKKNVIQLEMNFYAFLVLSPEAATPREKETAVTLCVEKVIFVLCIPVRWLSDTKH